MPLRPVRGGVAVTAREFFLTHACGGIVFWAVEDERTKKDIARELRWGYLHDCIPEFVGDQNVAWARRQGMTFCKCFRKGKKTA